ncbi:PIN domain-containing protein [Candidatus Woesearchaeota archaeon]|nr:PIN domain-containing protein [Candidatus Woesearchaeota archaeon]
MELYFLDTYALFELFKGNDGYKRFEKGVAVITTRLNLMEFYYILLRINAANADHYYGNLLNFVVDISDEVIKKAMGLRFASRAKELSYVDAVGYTVALEKNANFVTGDEQFKDMENVDFIK